MIPSASFESVSFDDAVRRWPADRPSDRTPSWPGLLAGAVVFAAVLQADAHHSQARPSIAPNAAPGIAAEHSGVTRAAAVAAALRWAEPAYPAPLSGKERDIRDLPAARYWDKPAEPRTGRERPEGEASGAAGKAPRFPVEAVVPAIFAAKTGLLQGRLAPTQADVEEELTCLALNIYFEARQEPVEGQLAVAHVVMNRVVDRRFPSTVCDVIHQGGERVRHRCQFSWWCDGRSDRPRNKKLWQVSQDLAKKVYWGGSEDPSEGALWYHADYVSPYWGRVFTKGPTIGRHIFYVADEKKVYLASRQ